MRLDWIELSALAQDLDKKLSGARVEQIYQPSAENVFLALRLPSETNQEQSKGFLYLNLHPKTAGAYFSPTKEATPEEPTPFCSLLRKFLDKAKIEKILPLKASRTLRIFLATLNGPCCLQAEFFNADANLILTDAASTVLGSLFRQNLLISNPLPQRPHPKPSLSEITLDEEEVRQALENKDNSYFLQKAREFTPRLLQFLFTKNIEPAHFSETTLNIIQNTIQSPANELLFDDLGLSDYNIYPELPWEGKRLRRESLNLVFAEILPKALQLEDLRKTREEGIQRIKDRIRHQENLLLKLNERLEEYKTYPELEKNGNLLKSQRERHKPFQKTISVINYYSEGHREIILELDPSLSIDDNIQRLFKLSRKYKRGIPRTEDEIRQISERLIFIKRTQDQIRHETDVHKLALLMQKLESTRQIRSSKETPSTSKQKAKPQKLRLFQSSEGASIYAGRNARENDYIVRHVGSEEDLWFHAKDIAGSHILLLKKPSLTDISIREAAQLAAHFSNAREEGKVEVIYTPLKYVHRVAGANPGQVRLDKHETILVRTDQNILTRLEKNLLQNEPA